ncbi:MAG: shikimate dehydrogenase [Anaerolineae bacterium]|nr:shikimate dehydrogenase [Anaerolineae bacterium]
MIDGRTQLTGLIGWPVEHSLSPAMQNAAFSEAGLNWCYVPLPTPPEKLEDALRGLVALGFRGVNVTIPHKQAVIPLLDSVSPNARALGAVNTIFFQRTADGKTHMYGENTDEEGFIDALHRVGVHFGSSDSAIIVGAGGAARAVLSSLMKMNLKEVYVLNRNEERARLLVQELTAAQDTATTEVHALALSDDALVELAQTASLLVNATPVGTMPNVDKSVWPDKAPVPGHLVVFDLVYNPRSTRLLQQARASLARGVDGLEMLVQQGALAFEFWTGKPAPVQTMRAACLERLGR